MFEINWNWQAVKYQVKPTREFPTKFPNWDLSHFAKFGIFMGIL